MYHQQQQQQLRGPKQHHLSSRLVPSLPPDEKQFLLQGGGDYSGLILSTDAKPRLKWTPELHERFVEAINQLGGPEKATPKTIMKLMGIPGLTLYHLKSHLQKYRLSKNLQAQANAVQAKSASGCRTATDKMCEGNGSPANRFTSAEPQINRSMHISEALQMQIEVQRRLHEQLEVQRHLQLRMEAQGKYLQSVLEKAQAALAKHSVVDDVVDGLEDFNKAQQQQQQRTTAPELVVARGAATKRLRQHGGVGDGSSVDSCLTTACEGGSQLFQLRDRDDMLLSIGLCTAPPWGKGRGEEARREYNNMFLEEEEPSGGGASPDDRKSINNNTNTSTSSSCRHRDCDKIDLNGSSWD